MTSTAFPPLLKCSVYHDCLWLVCAQSQSSWVPVWAGSQLFLRIVTQSCWNASRWDCHLNMPVCAASSNSHGLNWSCLWAFGYSAGKDKLMNRHSTLSLMFWNTTFSSSTLGKSLISNGCQIRCSHATYSIQKGLEVTIGFSNSDNVRTQRKTFKHCIFVVTAIQVLVAFVSRDNVRVRTAFTSLALSSDSQGAAHDLYILPSSLPSSICFAV